MVDIDSHVEFQVAQSLGVMWCDYTSGQITHGSNSYFELALWVREWGNEENSNESWYDLKF